MDTLKDLKTDSMNTKSKYTSCPYNTSHRILRARMQYHLVKCKRTVKPEEEKSICPFDATHHVNKEEFEEHVKTCPNRKIIDSEKYAIESEEKKEDEPAASYVLPDLPLCEECWDDPYDPDYTYYPRTHLGNQPILRTMNRANSERKAFRQVERKKMIQINSGKPMDSAAAAAAVGVTVTNGRVMGRGRGKDPRPHGHGDASVGGVWETVDLDKVVGDGVGHFLPCRVESGPLRQPKTGSVLQMGIAEEETHDSSVEFPPLPPSVGAILESEEKKEDEPAASYVLPDLPPCEEYWDDPYDPDYTYYPLTHLENQPILRTMNRANSERKAFRQVERKKMIQFNSGKPMDSAAAAAAVGVTVTNGRVMGRGRGKDPRPLGHGDASVGGVRETVDLDKVVGDGVGHFLPCRVESGPLRQPKTGSVVLQMGIAEEETHDSSVEFPPLPPSVGAILESEEKKEDEPATSYVLPDLPPCEECWDDPYDPDYTYYPLTHLENQPILRTMNRANSERKAFRQVERKKMIQINSGKPMDSAAAAAAVGVTVTNGRVMGRGRGKDPRPLGHGDASVGGVRETVDLDKVVGDGVGHFLPCRVESGPLRQPKTGSVVLQMGIAEEETHDSSVEFPPLPPSVGAILESEEKKEDDPAASYVLPDLPPCEEYWDDPYDPDDTYYPDLNYTLSRLYILSTILTHLENQPILRTMNRANSERKAFRQVERKKMIQFNSGKPMDSAAAAAAVGVTVTNGRVMGRGRGKDPRPLGHGDASVGGVRETVDLDKVVGDGVGHFLPCRVESGPLRQPKTGSVVLQMGIAEEETHDSSVEFPPLPPSVGAILESEEKKEDEPATSYVLPDLPPCEECWDDPYDPDYTYYPLTHLENQPILRTMNRANSERKAFRQVERKKMIQINSGKPMDSAAAAAAVGVTVTNGRVMGRGRGKDPRPLGHGDASVGGVRETVDLDKVVGDGVGHFLPCRVESGPLRQPKTGSVVLQMGIAEEETHDSSVEFPPLPPSVGAILESEEKKEDEPATSYVLPDLPPCEECWDDPYDPDYTYYPLTHLENQPILRTMNRANSERKAFRQVERKKMIQINSGKPMDSAAAAAAVGVTVTNGRVMGRGRGKDPRPLGHGDASVGGVRETVDLDKVVGDGVGHFLPCRVESGPLRQPKTGSVVLQMGIAEEETHDSSVEFPPLPPSVGAILESEEKKEDEPATSYVLPDLPPCEECWDDPYDPDYTYYPLTHLENQPILRTMNRANSERKAFRQVERKKMIQINSGKPMDSAAAAAAVGVTVTNGRVMGRGRGKDPRPLGHGDASVGGVRETVDLDKVVGDGVGHFLPCRVESGPLRQPKTGSVVLQMGIAEEETHDSSVEFPPLPPSVGAILESEEKKEDEPATSYVLPDLPPCEECWDDPYDPDYTYYPLTHLENQPILRTMNRANSERKAFRQMGRKKMIQFNSGKPMDSAAAAAAVGVTVTNGRVMGRGRGKDPRPLGHGDASVGGVRETVDLDKVVGDGVGHFLPCRVESGPLRQPKTGSVVLQMGIAEEETHDSSVEFPPLPPTVGAILESEEKKEDEPATSYVLPDLPPCEECWDDPYDPDYTYYPLTHLENQPILRTMNRANSERKAFRQVERKKMIQFNSGKPMDSAAAAAAVGVTVTNGRVMGRGRGKDPRPHGHGDASVGGVWETVDLDKVVGDGVGHILPCRVESGPLRQPKTGSVVLQMGIAEEETHDSSVEFPPLPPTVGAILESEEKKEDEPAASYVLPDLPPCEEYWDDPYDPDYTYYPLTHLENQPILRPMDSAAAAAAVGVTVTNGRVMGRGRGKDPRPLGHGDASVGGVRETVDIDKVVGDGVGHFLPCRVESGPLRQPKTGSVVLQMGIAEELRYLLTKMMRIQGRHAKVNRGGGYQRRGYGRNY